MRAGLRGCRESRSRMGQRAGFEDQAGWRVGRVGRLYESPERSGVGQAVRILIDSVLEARVPGSAQRRGLERWGGSQTVLCGRVVRQRGSD